MSCGSCASGAAVSSKANADFMPENPRLVYRIGGAESMGRATIFNMLLGAHESVLGGAWNAIARGRADGCESIQIFARPAQQWRARPLPPEEISLFRSEHAAVGWPAMSHASYLINLCAGDPVILDKSRDALAEEMTCAEELGLDFVVLHPGAHLGAGREDGIEAAAASLSEV